MNLALFASCLFSFAPPEAGDAPSTSDTSQSDVVEASDTDAESASASASASADETTKKETAPASEPARDGQADSPVPVGADPTAPPPKPGPPPEGIGAVGDASQAPLPPALPPVDPSTIADGPWRGKGWIALRLTVGGPLGGEYPARSRVVAFGGAGEVGWRVSNLVGVAMGLSRRPHDQATRTVIDPVTDQEFRVVENGNITQLDFAIGRIYWPLDGRVQPYVDVGGGLAVVEPPDRREEVMLGGSVRGAVGLDAWIARTVTLGVGTVYRANFVEATIGHHLSGFFALGLHW